MFTFCLKQKSERSETSHETTVECDGASRRDATIILKFKVLIKYSHPRSSEAPSLGCRLVWFHCVHCFDLRLMKQID